MDSEHMMNCLRQMRFIVRYMSPRHRVAETLMKMEVKHNARTNGKTKE